MSFDIASQYTLAEVLKAYDPQGKLHSLIDPFRDKRPMIEEGHWEQANDRTSHEMLQVTSRPTGDLRAVNQGYKTETVTTKPVTERLTIISSASELSYEETRWQDNPGEFRARRNRVHIRGLIKTFNEKVYYGDPSLDEKDINGLALRHNTITFCRDMGGTSNLYPVWIIKHGTEAFQYLYPKGGKTTFEERDEGLVTLYDSEGRPFPGYRSYFDLRFGIAQGDDRCVRRMVNVDVTAIKSSSDFEDALIEELEELPDMDNTAIYIGRQAMAAIKQRLNSKSNINYTLETIWGRQIPAIQGVPFVKDDTLSLAESQMVA